MEGLPENYRDNITVDNGVEIVWVDGKGQAVAPAAAAAAAAAEGDGEKKSLKDAEPPRVSVVAGTPRVVTSPPTSAGTPTMAGTPAIAVFATPERSKRKSVSGTVSAPDLIGTWFTTAPEGSESSAPSSPTSDSGENEDDEFDPDGHPCMALEPYASKFYYKERRGLLGKKRTPMETLLSWRKKGLSSPLTMACRKDNDIWSESVAAFGIVMKYMGNKSTRESGMQLLKKLQKRLVEQGPEFKDEVLCQVAKQTTSNPDGNSDVRGWQLLLAVLAVALPSKELAPPLLRHCELGPVGSIAQVYAKFAAEAIKKVGKVSRRRTPPFDVEIMALVQLSAVPVMVSLQDGNMVEVTTDSWTTAIDIEGQMAKKLAIKDAAPFGVFEVANKSGERAMGGKDAILDTVAQWKAQTASVQRVKAFRFLYKVRVHLRPDPDDLPAVKLTYLQAVRDLLEGVYVVTVQDCVQLAAFQLQATHGDYDVEGSSATKKKKKEIAKGLDKIVPAQVILQPIGEDYKGEEHFVSEILDYYKTSLKGVSKKGWMMAVATKQEPADHDYAAAPKAEPQ